jgi:hydrogenase expression/formation protein HypC
MCLSVPGRVTEVFDDDGLRMGKVAFGGVAKSVCLEHVPDAAVGDYVLVHVGFALARIDEAEAARIFEFLATLRPLEEELLQ